MKNRLILLSVLTVISLGFASCNKDVNPGAENNDGTGKLGVTLSFEKPAGTLAAGSTAIPSTSWSSIKSLFLVITKGDGANETISEARTVEIPSVGNTTPVFENITEGQYRVYMIANTAEATANTNGFYGGSIINKAGTSTTFWTAGSLKGKKMSDLSLEIKSLGAVSSDISGGAISGTGLNYDSPQEIFFGQNTDNAKVTVTSNTEATARVKLTRVVSLVRVRVDLDVNTTVDFTSNDATLALSRVQKGISFIGEIPATAVNMNDYIFKPSPFADADPTTGYSPSMIVDAKYTLWKETIMFPTKNGAFTVGQAGPVSGSKVFVKLSARVPEGYIFLNGQKAPAGGAMAYWGANVDVWFHANQITEINCRLTSAGSGEGEDVIPTSEGSMKIEVSYADWSSNIQDTEIDM